MNKTAKITSVSFALMLIISTFAFAYMIGSETKIVSAINVNDLQSAPVGSILDRGYGESIKKYGENTWVVTGGQTYNQRTFTASDIGGLYNLETASLTLASTTPQTDVSTLGQEEQVTANQEAAANRAPTPNVKLSTEGFYSTNLDYKVAPVTTIPTLTSQYGAPTIAQTAETIIAQAPLETYTVQNAFQVYDGKNNIQVKTFSKNEEGEYFVMSGRNTILLDRELSTNKILVGGTIDPSKLAYKESAVSYTTQGDVVTGYKTRTIVGNNGRETTQILSSTSGGTTWEEIRPLPDGSYKLPDGFVYDPKTKTFSGGIGRVISNKGENAYIEINGKVYVQGSDGLLRKSPYVGPEGSVPTEFDATGNPTKWVSPSGANYNNNGKFLDRGTMKVFGTDWSFGVGQVMEGLKWAGIAAGLTMTLGSLFIKDKQEVAAMTAGIVGGILIGKTAYAFLGRGGINGKLDGKIGEATLGSKKVDIGGNWLSSPWTSAAIGAASAWLIYNAMWSKEKTSTETVTFTCLPWQAPQGGKDCELCNDATLPCSEYRCKSLGQSCAIVNKGTKEERCVNINPRDSSPPVIKPLESEITEGYSYTHVVEMPPGAGFNIESSKSNGCIPAYTPLKFAITTNEPSQCKIDIEAKGNYSRMATFMGGSNLYSYNHTESLNLPSSADIKNSSITLQNGKELLFYIRCKDAAGNANEADYALKLCVDPSPDNTAPVVHGTSIKNKGCVPADAENATVEFYVNEPAQCRWDFTDRDYEQMKTEMTCSTNPAEINAIESYTCVTKLNGIARDGTNFYVRCKDQPSGTVNESKRNTNKESYVFNLRGSNQLKLKVVRPNETIYGAVRPAPVELYAETLFGCEDNKAICYYSTTNSPSSFIQFFDTDKQDGVHTQRLDLGDGTHTYFIRCIDAGGNVANTTTKFKVSIDVNAPVVARAYEEEGYLKLVTPLNSECVYNSESCDYLFSEGTQMPYANSTTHVTEWFPDKKYFIKCRDEYRSEPVDCSLIVRPTENFLGV
ncbi:MAG: hypothetical protein WCI72_00805 [archaeon]